MDPPVVFVDALLIPLEESVPNTSDALAPPIAIVAIAKRESVPTVINFLIIWLYVTE
jgi:hypothetical protein